METLYEPKTPVEVQVDQAQLSEDEAAMAEVGKRQQLKRSFGFWTILGLTASMMCTCEARRVMALSHITS